MSDAKINEVTVNFSRRSFVSKTATAAAGIAIAPGILLNTVAEARPAGEAATSDVRVSLPTNLSFSYTSQEDSFFHHGGYIAVSH